MEIQLVTPPILPLGFQFGRGEMQVLYLWIQILHLDGGREGGTFWKHSESKYRGVFSSYSYLVPVFFFNFIIIRIICHHHHHRHHLLGTTARILLTLLALLRLLLSL